MAMVPNEEREFRRAAQSQGEHPPPRSITSSARASGCVGT
jgi:hypothetical protein